MSKPPAPPGGEPGDGEDEKPESPGPEPADPADAGSSEQQPQPRSGRLEGADVDETLRRITRATSGKEIDELMALYGRLARDPLSESMAEARARARLAGARAGAAKRAARHPDSARAAALEAEVEALNRMLAVQKPSILARLKARLSRGGEPNRALFTPKQKTYQEELDATKLLEYNQRLKLRRHVGYGALILMGLQMACADWAFFAYGRGNDWQIPVSAIQVWLAATVIQTVSVVLVVTRYLFPSQNDESEDEGGGT